MMIRSVEQGHHMHRIIIPMAAELVAAIDDYRFENRLPSRTEAVRELIKLGLQRAASTTSKARKS
jgi:metal-responsive CopG/Arc/MetJ family transcriptional regulator